MAYGDDLATRDEALDEIQRWQTASGLLVGDDPDGVTPAMLSGYVERLNRVVVAAQNLRAHMGNTAGENANWPAHSARSQQLRVALWQALDALPKDEEEGEPCQCEECRAERNRVI